MRRNVYIPEESWRKLELLAKREGRSLSNMICRLADLYTPSTSPDFTGKTPDVSRGTIGRELDVADVAKVDGEGGGEGEGAPDIVKKLDAVVPGIRKSLQADIDEILGKGVRSYSKDKQLGKDRKK